MAERYVGLLGALAMAAVPATAGEPTLVPIGADYGAVSGFVEVVAGNATGPSIDIAVVPATYDETKDEAIENGDYDLALEHVAELDAACVAIVQPARFPNGCHVSLVDLWRRPDGDDPLVIAALRAADGAFVLGGDQGAAMTTIAGTPAEAALAQAYSAGAVVGGTSAGNAMCSVVMNNGYTDYGDSSVALQLGAIDVWFGDEDDRRGLSFGSTQAVFEQHLYERGRFGRFLNLVAQTGDQFGDGGLIGVGADVDTAPVVRNDARVSAVFGATSSTIVDFQTLGTTWNWVGEDGRPVANPSPTDTPTAALSARNVLVHILAPKASGGVSRVTYDFASREPSLNGRALDAPSVHTSSRPALTSSTPLILGGDLSVGPNWPGDSNVLRAFIGAARPRGGVLIITAGYEAADDATADIEAYSESLAASGWTRNITAKRTWSNVTERQLESAAGVIVLAGNQGEIPALMRDRAFGRLIRAAKQKSGVLMLDRSLAAVAGDVYNGIADDADAIEAFTSAQANVQRGLSLVSSNDDVAFEPRLQYDYRYGRLFGIANARRNSPPQVYGVSEGSALFIDCSGARVIGVNPVLRIDADDATFYNGDNGAFGALNAVLDVFEPAQQITRR